MDFDLSKENIQPLRGGRNASQLGAALQAQTDTESQKEILQQEQEFKNLIANYKGSDPLENWYNYISFIEQSYPKHGHEGNLAVILEKCLSEFEHDERYQQDRRLCKLFIKFIDLQQNPLELFKILYDRKLFIQCADLYRAWAYYYEAAIDFKEADKIFEMGFKNNAQPHDELFNAHHNFTFAVGRHVLQGCADANQLAEKRRALTSLRSYKQKHRTVVPSQRTGSNVVGYTPGVVGGGGGINKSDFNAKVNIFQDEFEENQPGPSEPESTTKPKSIIDSAAKRDVHKENMLKPGPWNGGIVQRKNNTMTNNATLKFTVHEDEALQSSGQSLLKTDSLGNDDPFHDFTTELYVPEPNDNTKISQYNIEEVYADNTEYSLEERYMRKYGYKSKNEIISTNYGSNFTNNTNSATVTTPLKHRLSTLKVSSPLNPTNHSEPITVNSVDYKPKNLFPTYNNQSNDEVAAAVESITTSSSSSSKIWHTDNIPNGSNTITNSVAGNGGVMLRNDSVTTHTKEAMNEVNNLWADSHYSLVEQQQTAKPVNNFQLYEDPQPNHSYLVQQNDQQFSIYTEPINTELQNSFKPKQNYYSHDYPQTPTINMHQQHQRHPQQNYQSPTNQYQLHQQQNNSYHQQQMHQPPQENYDITNTQMFNYNIQQTASSTPYIDRKIQHYVNNSHQQHQYQYSSPQQQVHHHSPQQQQQQNNNLYHLQKHYSPEQHPQMQHSHPQTQHQQIQHQQMQHQQMQHQQIQNQHMQQQMQLPTNQHFQQHHQMQQHQQMHNPSMIHHTSYQHSSVRQQLFSPENHSSYNFNNTSNQQALSNNIQQIVSNNSTIGGSETTNGTVQIPNNQEVYTIQELRNEDSTNATKLSNKLSIILEENSKEFRSCSSASSGSSGSCFTNTKSTFATTDNSVLPAIKEVSYGNNVSRDQCGMEYEVSEAMLQLSKEIYVNEKEERKNLTVAATSAPETNKTSNNITNSNDFNSSNYLRTSEIYIDQNSKHSTDSIGDYQSPQKDDLMLNESMDWDEQNSNSSADYALGCQNLSAILASDKPVDPFNPKVIDCLLKKARFPNMHHTTGYIKVMQIPKLAPKDTIFLKNDKYVIDKILGKGTFGTVVKATNSHDGAVVALKFQKPANYWEFYICREIQHRIKDSILLWSFMDVTKIYYCKQSSLYLYEYSKYGSLLNIANKVKEVTGKVMKDVVTYHFVVEMIRIISALHQCKIIHADIKPDNFLVMRLPPDSDRLSLQLIDFGCSIDMQLFPSDICFYKVITTEDFTCTEMREGKPWTYQTDLYCLAATAYVLLMGEYMRVKKEDGVWMVSKRFPRYVNWDIWKPFFRQMLNIESCDNIPDLTTMQSHFQSVLNERRSDLLSELRTIGNMMIGR